RLLQHLRVLLNQLRNLRNQLRDLLRDLLRVMDQLRNLLDRLLRHRIGVRVRLVHSEWISEPRLRSELGAESAMPTERRRGLRVELSGKLRPTETNRLPKAVRTGQPWVHLR